METPVELEIEGVTPSAHLRRLIDDNIAKLERRYGRVTACRVVIRAPDTHHRMGEPYFVTIKAALPNHRDVSVKPPSRALDARQSDLNFAVNDAFRRADRQLRDQVSRLKGRPQTHMLQPSGTIATLDPSGEFGYIETADGREIYFHANSLLGRKFGQLKPGTRVTFHEEVGEKGPQASTVRVHE